MVLYLSLIHILQIVVAGGEYVLGEVHAAVAGGFRTDEGTAPVQALAGENAGDVYKRQLQVLAPDEQGFYDEGMGETNEKIDKLKASFIFSLFFELIINVKFKFPKS